MIQIQNGRLHFNWLGTEGGAYPRYENVREGFAAALRAFLEFLDSREGRRFSAKPMGSHVCEPYPQGEAFGIRRTTGDSSGRWVLFRRFQMWRPERASGGMAFRHSRPTRAAARAMAARAAVRRRSREQQEGIRLTFTARGPHAKGRRLGAVRLGGVGLGKENHRSVVQGPDERRRQQTLGVEPCERLNCTIPFTSVTLVPQNPRSFVADRTSFAFDPPPLAVDTNADTESLITRGADNEARDEWQRLIDHKLIEWELDTSEFDDEGIEPPSRQIIRLAIALAEGFGMKDFRHRTASSLTRTAESCSSDGRMACRKSFTSGTTALSSTNSSEERDSSSARRCSSIASGNLTR